MKKTILFDLDGTLIDSSVGITTCVQYALRAFDIEVSDLNSLKCFIGPPLADSFQTHYQFTPENAARGVEKYRERFDVFGIYECELYSGIEKMLRALKSAGYQLGVASSKPEGSCRQILERFEIADCFDEIVGATLDGSRSSKVSVLQEAIKRLNLKDLSAVCLVGDTLFDVLGAKEAGISCIGVAYGFGERVDLIENGVVTVCDSPQEVEAYIKDEF